MSRSAFFDKPAPPATGNAAGAPLSAESTGAKTALPSSTMWQAQSSSRILRFPSSRKFLWDRTPLGRVEIVEPKEVVPLFSVSSDLHQRLGPDASAVALVSCPSGRRLHIALQSAAARYEATEDALVVPVLASSAGAGAQSQDQWTMLAQNLQHSLDQRGSARLTSGIALALALQESASSTGAGSSGDGGGSTSATLTVSLLLPAAVLTLTPLYGKRLCDVPLAQSLSQQQALGSGIQTGFLTMDQARSLLPLAADDANVYSVPLVGVWVRGARGTEHPSVYGTALKFSHGCTLPDRAMQPDGAFLLLLFTGESPVARCYEARFTDPSARQEPRPQAPTEAQNSIADLTSPGGSSGTTQGGEGLRLLPYMVRAELAGQTTAPLELRPVFDSLVAAAGGPRLTLPSSSSIPLVQGHAATHRPAQAQAGLPASTPKQSQGHGFDVRSGSASAGGVPYMHTKYDVYGMLQLRGSGSKLMTSPSKAMKILAQGSSAQGPAAGDSTPGISTASGVFRTAAIGSALSGHMPWADSAHSAGVPRDSPPMPRCSVVPTPFRPVPGYGGGGSSGDVSGGGGSSGDASGGSAAPPPRDPRLHHRGSAAAASTVPDGPPVAATAPNRGNAQFESRPASVRAPAATAFNRVSDDWIDPVGGIMNTPAALPGPRASQFAATPGAPHDPLRSHHQLQHRYHLAAGFAARSQAAQQQQPWESGRAAANNTPAHVMVGPTRELPPAGTSTSAATAEGAPPNAPARQNPYDFGTPRYGIQASGGFAPQHTSLPSEPLWGPAGTALLRPHPASGASGASAAGRSGANGSSAQGAVGGGTQPTASQSLDKWLQATGAADAYTGPQAGPSVTQHHPLRDAAAASSRHLATAPGPYRPGGDAGAGELPRGGAEGAHDVAAGGLPSRQELGSEPAAPPPPPVWRPQQLQQQSASWLRQPGCCGHEADAKGAWGAQHQAAAADAVTVADCPQRGCVDQRQQRGVHDGLQSRVPGVHHAQHGKRHHQEEEEGEEGGGGDIRPRNQNQVELPPCKGVVALDVEAEEDDLPSDPVLLRREVLRLRGQVAELQSQLQGQLQGQLQSQLQSQLQGVAAASQRLALGAGECTAGASANPSGCSTSLAASGARERVGPASWQQEGHGGLLGITSATECDASATRWQDQQHQQQRHQQQYQSEFIGAQQQQRSSGHAAFLSNPLSHPAQSQPNADGRSAPASSTTATVPEISHLGTPAVPPGSDTASRAPDDQRPMADAAAVPAGSALSESMLVSEASERGSVWSMASLRSSIMSYHSCRSLGASGSSADMSSIQNGGAVACSDSSDPGLDARSNDSSDGGALPPALHIPDGLTATPGCHDHADYNAVAVATAAAAAVPAVSIGAATAGPRSGVSSRELGADGQSVHARAAAEPSVSSMVHTRAAAEPSVSSMVHAAKYLRLSGAGGWERRAGVSVGRGRRRSRRASSSSDSDSDTNSGSDSDRSMASDVYGDAVVAGPPLTAAPTVRLAASALHRGSWAPQPDGGGSDPGDGIWRAPSPLTGVLALPADDSASGVARPVVRTKYVPLDEDSDSSDSESELMLMQKYGIRAE